MSAVGASFWPVAVMVSSLMLGMGSSLMLGMVSRLPLGPASPYVHAHQDHHDQDNDDDQKNPVAGEGNVMRSEDGNIAHDFLAPAESLRGDRPRCRDTSYTGDLPAAARSHVRYLAVQGAGTGSLAGDTIQDQARQAMANCEAILQAGGTSLDDVVEVGVLLANPADFAGLNAEYSRWFPACSSRSG
jgi:Endoribonuclease L-PSP